IIEVMPDVSRVIVACSNKEKGAKTRLKCTVGCIGCGKCERNCPAGAIKVVNNLATINYDLCQNCDKCAEGCPVKCIVIADFSGMHRFFS
ncbi:MAG: 4Fe-4S binding protein, partial [Clostridiales bacterium]|nr:4Fe-4S binding protein [Clostridiales bacterium]